MNSFLELLTSEVGEDGLRHACYPTATRTLCALPVSGERRIGRRWPPTCGICAKAARRIDVIDNSVPEHWRAA